MKFYTMSILLSLSLFAGGDILPVDPISSFEKMDNELVSNYVEDNDAYNSFKPTIIDNCVSTCGEPAELLAYHGEDIPDAATALCFAKDSVDKLSE